MQKLGMLRVLAWNGGSTSVGTFSRKLFKPFLGAMVLPAHSSTWHGGGRKPAPAAREADCAAARTEAICDCKKEYNPVLVDGDVRLQEETLAKQTFCIEGVVAAHDACLASGGNTDIARTAISDHFSTDVPPDGASPEDRQLGIDMFFSACDEAEES